jgi:hypothetical protein
MVSRSKAQDQPVARLSSLGHWSGIIAEVNGQRACGLWFGNHPTATLSVAYTRWALGSEGVVTNTTSNFSSGIWGKGV